MFVFPEESRNSSHARQQSLTISRPFLKQLFALTFRFPEYTIMAPANVAPFFERGKRMRKTILILAGLWIFTGGVAAADVTVQPNSPMLAFAGKEISDALTERKKTAPAARLGGPRVVAGVFDWLPDKAGVSPPPQAAEAYAITRMPDGRIVVAGHDEPGAMYGALEVAEQIRLGGAACLSSDAASVASKSSKPFLAVRQYKYNLPSVGDGLDYFHSEEHWRGFFDLLARARFNSIGFWHLHPFPFMIAFDRFPEAAVLSPDHTARNIRTFSMIFRLAKERNIRTFLINWNIHLSSKLAAAHKIPDSNFDSPLVRDYMRYCVAQTLKTYPDLTGLGVCAGERMPSEDYDWREQWIKDTFVAGVKDAGRVVPLLHRYWYAAPDSIQRIICADYPGEVYVEIKYNGEHMYSGLRNHFLDPDWIDFPDYMKYLSRDPQKAERNVMDHLQWINLPGRTYKIMWHLRNDCVFLFRWGDPAFVRSVIENSHPEYSVGFLMGEESVRPGPDTSHTEKAQPHQTWQYEWERHWFRFLLWGRLSYDPSIPEDRWRGLFRARFGADGDDLYTAYARSSFVIPATTRFHFNYMNGDWQPEWCWGLWNTGFGRGYNYRDRQGFHNVIEFVFNHTIEDALLDIPEYVGMLLRGETPPAGVLTPLQVADQLEAASKETAEAVARVRARGAPRGEAECYCEEFAATAALGLYYAEKIRAATDLMRFFAAGDPNHRQSAVARLQAARDAWMRFVALSAPHYRKASSPPQGCQRTVRDVERDILIAQNARAAPAAIEELGVLQRAAQRRRFDFSRVADLVRATLVPYVPPVRQIDEVVLSPASCDVMVLGKEAWGFDALSADKKRAVVDAVAEGVNLVIFFQNFPKFDASWLPGNIAGSEKDADAFRWTSDHPIAKGVEPADLSGRAVVNDPLDGGDDAWQSLTEPRGGLMLRRHGKGWIIFCQLDVLHRYKDPAARRLLENIIAFAAGDRKTPRVVLLDEPSGADSVMAQLKLPFLWYDELPLKAKE